MNSKTVFCFLGTLCALAAVPDGALAARFFFSQVGQPVLSNPSDPDSNYVAPSPLTVGDRPEIFATPGETFQLHVWVRPDAPPPSQSFLSAALDIDSSNGALAHATNFEVFNPGIRNEQPNARWNGKTDGAVGAPGTSDWITNAAAARVAMPGIGNNPDVYLDDPGRDFNTGAFYFGKLAFQANAIGVTGLYFRVGSSKTILAGGGGAPVEFGAPGGSTYQGNIVGAGDPITADLVQADAIIRVAQIPEPTGLGIAVLGLFGLACLARRSRRST